MQHYIRHVQAVLVLYSAIAIASCWVLAEQNGLFAHLRKIRDAGPAVLPGTSEPLRTHYTGINAVDKQFQLLMVFFFEVISGRPPAAVIQAFHFGGQFGAGWTLIALEAARYCNKGTVLAFVAVWGLLVQNLSFAATIPLYLALHLGISRGVKPEISAIMAPAADLAALPPAMFLGFIVPSVLLALPAPAYMTYDQKQIVNAVWQVFPLTVAILQRILSRVLTWVYVSLAPFHQDYKITRRLLHFVYASAALMAATSHIAAVTLPLVYDIMPDLFHPYLQSISFRSTFVPVMAPLGYNSTATVATIGAGAHLFLQYDEILSSAALLLWASYVHICAWEQVNWVNARVLSIAIVGLVVAMGPVGAAVVLLWVRDEEVLRNKAEEKH
jgi:hypothetical protein